MAARIALAALAGACLAATRAAAGDVAQVGIAQNRFAPAQLTVKAGTTVRWTNGERRTGHAIVVSGPARAQSGLVAPGQSWQHTFDQPGLYHYSCVPHPEMKGVVEVVE